MQIIKRLSTTLVPPAPGKVAIAGATLLAFLGFLSTLQLDVNGSRDPFATDVGEIQNALPRWGIIHFNGYPLYSILGSTFVTLLRLLRVPPAMGASLFSAIWGAISVGLLVALALAFEVPALAAAAAALLLALSASFWIDASIAEVHTMSTALTLGTLIAALRFGRNGQRSDLLGLAFLAGQAVAHQPASILLLPALAVLALPRWRTFKRSLWRALPAAAGLALLGPLTYLYLPIRVWQGADWVFGAPQTWEGFRHLAMDSKSYVVRLPQTPAAWLERGKLVLQLLANDLPLPLTILGLLGLLWTARKGRWVEAAGLSMAWFPYLALSLIIWEKRVSDALLAAKLPVIAMATLGTAVLAGAWVRRWRGTRSVAVVAACLWLVIAGAMYVKHRPAVLAIARDPEAKEIIAAAAQIQPASDGKPVVLTALWGLDYWALAYAQAYRGELPDLRLVKHDAGFEAILERGEHLVTLSRTFYAWPPQRWKKRLGRLYLSSFAPGVVEMNAQPILEEQDIPPGQPLALDNGVTVRHASLSWTAPDALLLTVYWQAQTALPENYSIAVHLVSQDPPAGPQDILSQADRDHPIGGWYPTSSWRAGEIVRDHYPLPVPIDATHRGVTPRAVRLSMYRALGNGQFQNTRWLTIPVPPIND